MPTKLRNNIKKRVAAHHRKVRKEAKKLKVMGVKQKGPSNLSLPKTKLTSSKFLTCILRSRR